MFEAHFPPGVYSRNKDLLKTAWGAMGFKYSGGYQDASTGYLLTSWSGESGTIKAEFHGTGADCLFTVEGKDQDVEKDLKDLMRSAGATVTEPEPLPEDTLASLKEQARKEVEATFVLPQQNPGEPQKWYERRISNEVLEKERRIDERFTALVKENQTQQGKTT